MRELVYVARITDIRPIEGKDRVECAVVNNWTVMVKKGQFQIGDLGIYFEMDSQVRADDPRFSFLQKYKYKIKMQKYKNFYSQGLLLGAEDLGWAYDKNIDRIKIKFKKYAEGAFLTNILKVTYASQEDNIRKKVNKDTWLMKLYFKYRWKWLKPFISADTDSYFPVGRFAGVSVTDQERCENLPNLLSNKTPLVVTEKADGSSATYILESLGKGKYEFYVCSRNIHRLTKDNVWWEVAKKYDIYNKLKNYLSTSGCSWVAWQGEVCSPNIQGNPHHLTETHFFPFHWIDSNNGKWHIADACKEWKEKYGLTPVTIIDTNYILPDDFEEFKKTADHYYSTELTEGKENIKAEGYVYYNTKDPYISFKNVSREYLNGKGNL